MPFFHSPERRSKSIAREWAPSRFYFAKDEGPDEILNRLLDGPWLGNGRASAHYAMTRKAGLQRPLFGSFA